MTRKMAGPGFHASQWDQRYAPHVAAINRFVDSLEIHGNSGPAVYVAPHQGGSKARLVTVMSNPGPRAGAGKGSGFISCENDDGTAARICGLYAESGIDQSLTVPWNAYPWYVHDELKGSGITAAMRDAGLEPFKRFLDCLPDAAIVVSHGNDAKGHWRHFMRVYGGYVLERDIKQQGTWHTGNRALATNRKERLRDLNDTYAWAARQLGL